MGYVRVELETGQKNYTIAENWYDSQMSGPPEDPIPHLETVLAKVKAAYEAGS